MAGDGMKYLMGLFAALVLGSAVAAGELVLSMSRYIATRE